MLAAIFAISVRTADADPQLGGVAVPRQPSTSPASTQPAMSGAGKRRIIYVCDGSGSLFGTRALSAMKQSLAESVNALADDQRFWLVFFQGDQLRRLGDKNALWPGKSPQRAKAHEFIDTLQPKGDSEPRPALREAFELRPDQLYLIIDGVESTTCRPDDAAAELRKLNRNRSTRVDVIIVGRAGDEYRKTWRDISHANGGTLIQIDDAS